MNILEEANKIVNQRSEEKERQYGPFSEGMERAAMIFNGMEEMTMLPKHLSIHLEPLYVTTMAIILGKFI